MKSLLFLLLYFNIGFINCNNEEKYLRNYLFEDYNKLIRPVNNYKEVLNVSMGLGVQNLEAFNQKKETIDINLWVRLNWNDAYLNWNTSTSNLTFLSVDKSYTWVPDIELLNAASLPNVYTLKGGMNLYNNGNIMWSNPAIYRFSCGLELQYFPFDTQQCKMKFSSWIYDNKLVRLKPDDDIYRQIDILESFSHSEWDINNVTIQTYNEKRPCCPNTYFSVNEYTISLKRFPHYYNISMGMTISLVIVNFIIMLIKPDNISRTSTAVFIPLTILALQLTLADKIPVVGYYTLMDHFFLCCFVTSMICSIESALVFAIITSKSKFIYNIFNQFFVLEKLIKDDNENNHIIKNRLKKHNNITTKIKEHEKLNCVSETDVDTINDKGNNYESDLEFKDLYNMLKKNRSCSDIIQLKNKIIDSDIEYKTNDIIKTISYDDVSLSLTYKEILIFNELEKYVKLFDNVCRVLFPLIFIIIIGVLYRHKN